MTITTLAPPPAPAMVAVPQERDRRMEKRDRRERRMEAMPRHRRGDQDFAFRAVRAGEIMSLSEIEARVVPRMRDARYMGSTFDRDAQVYTLKFRREAAVIWVTVDGRSGRVIGR